MPLQHGTHRLGKRAASTDVQDLPDIESIQEHMDISSPLRVRKRVEATNDYKDDIKALRQEILELRAETKAQREEIEVLRERQSTPALVPLFLIPQPPLVQVPPPVYVPPPRYVPKRVARKKLDDKRQSQGLTMQSAPIELQSIAKPNCSTCGKQHGGQCRFRPRICYRRRQPGHIAK